MTLASILLYYTIILTQKQFMHLQSPENRGNRLQLTNSSVQKREKINKMHDNTQLTNVINSEYHAINKHHLQRKCSQVTTMKTGNVHKQRDTIISTIMSQCQQLTCKVQYIENQVRTTVICQHAACFHCLTERLRRVQRTHGGVGSRVKYTPEKERGKKKRTGKKAPLKDKTKKG